MTDMVQGTETRLTGIGVSDGVALARARVRAPERADGAHSAPAEPSVERARLEAAREAVRRELRAEAERAAQTVGEENARILLVQEAMLDDPLFFPEVLRRVEADRLSAEAAVQAVAEELAAQLAALDNAYLRERAADVRDIARRLVRILRGDTDEVLGDAGEPVVLVVDDLLPSDATRLDPNRVHGVVARVGGKTSHAAILLRALGIPAVFGVAEALEAIQDGDLVVLDGTRGRCVVNPEPETLKAFEAKVAEERRLEAEWEAMRDRPAQSRDGQRVTLEANIGTPAEVAAALASGAEGVGLFRTEFLFLESPDLPGEEAQYRAYREVVERMGGRPVTIRTLDVGGDKELPALALPKESNPFLGYRAIRLCLERRELFETQLRAILRASAHGPVRILFPMISSVDEWRAAKAVYEDVRRRCEAEGIPVAADIPLGIMVEVPAAALLADRFAEEVDFFSIGTNDLVQYTVAVDRTNEKVAALYDPFHPAVVRLIAQVIEAAHRRGKPVGMCGGMAGEPLAAPLLLGLGLDEWSMEAGALRRIKLLLHRLDASECRALAARVLALGTAAEVRAALEEFLQAAEG